MTSVQTHSYDVVVVGAGGAGLRAALEAHEAGARVAIVCKSLLGKAHTVMAEGGIAASMGNVWSDDNWRVHFRDTMRGGKMLNQWRMAQLHAQEAPDRVWELEEWGAVFDRTPDGRILQRDFGGHRFARLAHVGDRTGLELIRTLQNRVTARGLDVFMECTVLRLLTDGPSAADPGADADSAEPGRIAGAFAYWRESGTFVRFDAPSVILATGGIGKSYKVTSNSWEYTGDGHSLALWAGAALMDMEFVQFHPTGMVWPPSVKGILVTEGVRGDGGILRNSEGRRFMFDYIPEVFASETANTEEEADRWYSDKKTARRPPELLPRDEVARAINSEIKEGRGSPHGGVFLDIASRRDPAYIQRRLPSMYHQFKELADVDITKEPMEVGPTCHYVMGGIKVDPDTAAATVPGLYAAGECAAGMHGSNRLGGNSLGDLLVFGKRAGQYAAEYAAALPTDRRPVVSVASIEAITSEALAPFDRAADRSGAGSRPDAGSDAGPVENPYTLQLDLQDVMQSLVGIIRTESELTQALKEIEALRVRARRVGVEGHRQYNPGWHLAVDIISMLTVSECIAKAALARKESRGGHTRDDFPTPDPAFAKINHVLRLRHGTIELAAEPLPVMPDELATLFTEAGAPTPPVPVPGAAPRTEPPGGTPPVETPPGGTKEGA
ncbi:MAG: fumarate reductase/succinate dehydrogenase flavoprotein subunit [Frankia sp.]